MNGNRLIQACIGLCSLGVAVARAEAPVSHISYLDQGWSAEDRDWFHYTSQGSRLIPYRWFLALEQSGGAALFRDDAHLDALRFLRGEKSLRNPDRLPIGFVKDEESIEERNPRRVPGETSWLGFTCAACHTAKVESGKQAFYVDGGPTQADLSSFLERLVSALNSTARHDNKFQRFATRVLGSSASEKDRTVLLNAVKEFTTRLSALADRSRPTHSYGFARLDAFGILLNEITGTGLGLPANVVKPDAPVSYPFLWNTPDFDWVQWNGSASSPLARNMGEVLGVFAELKLSDLHSIVTSAQIKSLYGLEERIKTLKAPRWPEGILGSIDQVQAARGQALYRRHCIACHDLPGCDGHYVTAPQVGIDPKDPLARDYRSVIKIEMVPLSDIGTDPVMANSFLSRTGKTGILKPALGNRDEVPIRELVGAAVGAVIGNEFARLGTPPAAQFEMNDRRRVITPTEEHLRGYKARPLDGIWATAPYLHNGSVKSLFELLLPASKRKKTFQVGGRQFDAKNVGFFDDPTGFTFETSLPGNWNTGHEYGARLTDDERYDLIEFLKKL
jgi:hypothetical protein